MKVVFPNPDSPATFEALANIDRAGGTLCNAYHDGKSSSSLCDNLVSLIWQIRNPNWGRAFRGWWSHCGGIWGCFYLIVRCSTIDNAVIVKGDVGGAVELFFV